MEPRVDHATCPLPTTMSLPSRIVKGVHLTRQFRTNSSMIDILKQVKSGEISPVQAHELLSKSDYPPKNILEYANLDYSRSVTAGFPEAVFAEGKSVPQVHRILESLSEHSTKQTPILATRYVFVVQRAHSCPLSYPRLRFT